MRGPEPPSRPGAAPAPGTGVHAASTGRRARRAAGARMAAVAAAVVAIDQLSKRLVRGSIPLGAERHVLPGLAFVHARNQGIAFGIHVGGAAVLGALVAVALGALALYLRGQGTRRLVWLPAGMIVGGAVGNLVDRASAGYVTDFIKLPLGWPPFNVADAAITLGVVGLIVLAGADDARRRRTHGSAPEAAGAGPGRGERPGGRAAIRASGTAPGRARGA
jgi:signal peptidase II